MLGINRLRDTSRKSAEMTRSLLSQVNQLVSQGLHQAAIALLEEAISDAPNNTPLLNALGRVYRLNRQLGKADVFLRQSLGKPNPRSDPLYEYDYLAEAFTSEDVDYIEELAKDLSNDEFSPLGEFSTETSQKESLSVERTDILHLKVKSESRGGNTQKTDGSEPQITFIKRRRVKKNDHFPAASPEVNDGSQTASSDEIALVDDAESDKQFAPKLSEISNYPTAESGFAFDDYDGSDSTEYSFELLDDADSVDNIIGADDNYESDLDEVDPEVEPVEDFPLDDFELEDFGWEDLDDFEEEASRENDDEDLMLTGISRGERARQVAVEVLERVGWDREYLPLLETIFVESGWGAARIAIETQIEGGAVPEQIILARQVRSIWFSNEYLWTTFRMRSNAPFMQADAVYKNFSWADALKFIRCFSSIPDRSEVETFIEDLFEEWYFNNRLRRHFHAFLKYFRYRIGTSRRTLPGNLGFLFIFPLEAEWGVDNPELSSEISEMRSELRDLGTDSGFGMSRIENKFKVLPKEAFDEKEG